MAGIPQNTTYNPLFGKTPQVGGAAGAIRDLATRSAKPARKAVDVSRYNGLAQVVKARPGEIARRSLKQTRPTPQSWPKPVDGSGIKDLGVITTRPGESTRYEGKHPGLDIANDIGTPIRAFEGGQVVEVVRGKRQGQAGYGNYVKIKDRYGNIHRYSHLDNTWMQPGDEIRRGEYLGQMGNTGSTYSLSGGTGSHLDYRVEQVQGAYRKYVDPFRFVNQTNSPA